VLFLGCCVYGVLDGRHPPALAQQPIRYDIIPATSAADEHRDDLLVDHDRAITELNRKVQDQWAASKSDHDVIVAMQAEERIISGILALLIGSSITLQVVGRRKV
jgi:hypothetical protein